MKFLSLLRDGSRVTVGLAGAGNVGVIHPTTIIHRHESLSYKGVRNKAAP